MKWEEDWSMEFNPDKFMVTAVTNKIKAVQHFYKMHGIYLQNVGQEEYFGVILHRKRSGKSHVSNIVAKANLTK